MSEERPLDIHVVDDDPEIVAVMTALLEAAGCRVTASLDGITAFERIVANPPDCVLLDIMMPGLDGLEICRQLKERPDFSDRKVIVVSAKAYEFDRARAHKFGADGFVRKPIHPDTFADEVRRIVDDQVEMTFWGVRGTLPVPGPKAFRYGGNTSCMTLSFPRGQYFIFDAGSGIKELSDHLAGTDQRRIEAKIFISHPHWDHINALPFFVPLYVPGNEFEILGSAHGDTTMRELISAQMDDVYFPITLRELGARVYFRDLTEGTFEVDGIEVKTLLLSHPGQCLGFRIGYKGRSICYVTDNELYLPDSEFHNAHYVKRLTAFVEGAEALITDCTYSDEDYRKRVGWGHSCPGPVAELAHAARVKTLHLFHHDPDQDDDAIDAKLAAAQAALDGLGSDTVCLAPAEGQTFRI